MSESLSRRCSICGEDLRRLLYRSPGGVSITSLCQVWPGETIVHRCDTCGHIQTDALPDIEAYYDREYDILVESEEEDQIYRVVDGKPVYRTDHQVATLIAKVPLAPGALVLDYGCAKGASLRQLKTQRSDIVPHLFDVSDRYVDFWRTFALPENWATYAPPPHWAQRFDLITSFYAFEHMARPSEVLGNIHGLLKPGGLFYGVVPNVFTNTADFIVADHVNHFTEGSLARLLQQSGFEVREVDAVSHDGAFVFFGTKVERRARVAPAAADPRVEELARYWSSIGRRVREFEAMNGLTRRAAIYGSGFYGTFIATCLSELARVECFLDQSPYRQGKRLLGKPIIDPAELAPGVEIVYVGLNPRIARDSIAAIRAWSSRNYRFFYL